MPLSGHGIHRRDDAPRGRGRARGEPGRRAGRGRGNGYFARCLAHETDHCAGRLRLDRLSE
ncbi:peptide deformylase [Streptomyces sp. NPDC002611]